MPGHSWPRRFFEAARVEWGGVGVRGTIVNAVAILIGSGIGLAAGDEFVSGVGGGDAAQDGPRVPGVVTGA